MSEKRFEELRADKVDGGFRLTGTKFWITNAPYAQTLVVYAKSEPDAGSKGIIAFLIEKDFAGFSIGQKIDKVGMRGSPTAELVFQDCFVPEDNVMGPLNSGAKPRAPAPKDVGFHPCGPGRPCSLFSGYDQKNRTR